MPTIGAMTMMCAEIQWTTQTVTMLCVFAVPITAIVINGWQKIEKSRADSELKRNMIQRGMTADEIERVLNARSSEK
jgi:hypothetical protein